ncbi:dipeptidase [Sphingosinicella rhizophila]|uniref:Membrane dipeptidase n=1 Tax=Sphingosinicella rhizophila TaxID=3050082 RepID=A0ABU3Q5M6_9SPHN|nr:membrane dipeptidase [Sphingosinicella sp. GR2756]MDT9598711.1 membrane dipeptidase [Sphingosinicella sp. GR2756]
MNALAPLSPRAGNLLRHSTVWDNHGCMPMRPRPAVLHQLQRYKAAGCSVVSINTGYGVMGWEAHLSLLNFMRDWLLERPTDYLLVQSPEDVLRAKLSDRLGIVFDVEGMVPVQDDPLRVHQLYRLGVKWMLIAYNRNNEAGGGCLDVDQGLTATGRQIIDEMEAAGMVLCLSHSGPRTAREALDYSRVPTILSHSNPLALVSHPRNASDELMKACAAKGGVIGINGIGPFLGTADDLVPAFLRHLRYVVDLVGPHHVGLGLDYVFDLGDFEMDVENNPEMHSPGIENAFAMVTPEDVPEIVEGLCGFGLTDAEVQGILGGNWLRVARQVWK